MTTISSPTRDPLHVTVYTPESPLHRPLHLVNEIIGDIWNNRELTLILFQRDLKAQFRQSVLGYAWLILPPLASAVVWHLLNSQKLINVDTGEVPYPVFVLIGSTLWSGFGATLLAPSDAITNNAAVFIKLNVPVESFILAGAARAIFNLVISSAVILPLILLQGTVLHWSAALFPISALAFLAIAFTLGMFLAPLGALYTDVLNMVAPLLGLLMFSAPVVFPVPDSPGILTLVMRLNPITPSLSLARDSLVTGDLQWLGATVVWFVVSMVLLLLMFICLRVAKPHIIQRMGM